MNISEFKTVPILDLSLPLDKVVQNMGDACAKVGFLYVKNHGIPEEVMESITAQSRAFFDISREEKYKVTKNRWNKSNPNTYRGYFPPQENASSYKEGIDFGANNNASETSVANDPLLEHNLWPNETLLPNFKPTVLNYFEHVRALGFRLMEAIARSLGLEPKYFDPLFQTPITTLRLLNYPDKTAEGVPITQAPPKDGKPCLSCSEHTDTGVITILYQDPTGGLQVKNSKGDFIDVPYIPGTFVINLGDMLQRWTNGRYVATVHRVLAVPSSRLSIPLFFEPGHSAPIEPLPTCVSSTEPAQYEKVIYGVFLKAKIAREFIEFQEDEKADGKETEVAPGY